MKANGEPVDFTHSSEPVDAEATWKPAKMNNVNLKSMEYAQAIDSYSKWTVKSNLLMHATVVEGLVNMMLNYSLPDSFDFQEE